MINLGYKHDDIINLVNTGLANDDVLSPLLIYGKPGSGKTFLSNEICKILLTFNVDRGKNVASISLKSSDLYVVDDNVLTNLNIITVDEVRRIKQWMSFSTLKSKYKILLINDIDRMNINASNAFLKILEEPIGNTIILLNTSRIEALPLTLKSRCIKLKLRKKNMEEFAKILLDILPSKKDIGFKGLYKLCNGNINLAIYIIENNHLDFFMQLKDQGSYAETLDYISQLSLEDSNDFELFMHSIYYLFSIVINTKINNNQQLSNSFILKVSKIENILSSIYYLNKTYSKELIISILRECMV